MAYTTIDNPEKFFQCFLYTGGDGNTEHDFGGADAMQPDLVWIKNRTQSDNFALIDSVRGSRFWLGCNVQDQEDYNNEAYLFNFRSDGFTTSNTDVVGKNTETYVSWNWKAGTSFTNDASSTSVGSIDSEGSINTTSGFSIIKYTGTGAAATVAHGLGATPGWFVVKSRSADGRGWQVFHNKVANTRKLALDDHAAQSGTSTAYWNDTSPNNTVFSLGSGGDGTANTVTFISYCWTPIKGFSKFGEYEGNGSSNGPFIYTGFKPAYVIVKSSTHAVNWKSFDNKRDKYNKSSSTTFNLNENGAEDDNSAYKFHLYSNGFKLRNSNANLNADGYTYTYLAWAEAPFVNSNGVPTNAR